MENNKQSIKKTKSLKFNIVLYVIIFSIIIILTITMGFSYINSKKAKEERIETITAFSKVIKTAADNEALSYSLLFCYDNINSKDSEAQKSISEILTSCNNKYDGLINSAALNDNKLIKMYIFTVENDNIVYLYDSTGKIDLFKPVPQGKDDREFFLNYSKYENGCERTNRSLTKEYFSASQKLEKYLKEKRQCYVLVDYSIDYFEQYSEMSFIHIGIFTLFIIGIMVLLILFIINKRVLHPIVSLSNVFTNYNYIQDNERLENLDIKSGDEIEVLYNAILKTKKDATEYVKQLNTATAEKERLNSELEIAGKLQESCMPKNTRIFLDKSKFDIAAKSEPAKLVGGDFYDCFMLDKDRVAFMIADVSGKGIASAIYMMKTKSSIRSLLTADIPLSEFLSNLNQLLTKENTVDMFVTLWLGVYNTATKKLNYVNAGHNPPFIKHNDGEFQQIKNLSGLFLGEIEGIKYKEFETDLNEGDSIFLYTDGITEANNRKKEFYGEERLCKILNKAKNLESEEIIINVKKDVDDFINGEDVFDDSTMLCLSVQREVNNIVINSDLSEMDKAFDFLEKWLSDKNITNRKINEIIIIADETLNNIISYGRATFINISISKNSNRICLKFCDDGVKFNPLENKKPLQINTPLSDRNIGGLGIFMVKELSDRLVYDYVDNQNCLIIYKKTTEKNDEN